MKDPLKIAMVVALVVLGGSLGALVYLNSATPSVGQTASGDAATPDETVTDLSIPAFSFVAQDGATVTNEAFKGCVTILDFTFTRCTLICPKMTGTMFELHQKLTSPAVRFMSMSVDPEHDTPAVLAEYAKRLEVVPPRWRFLSGDKAKVFSILREGLMFGIKENPPIQLPDGTTAPDIRHPPHFVLVGPDGRVLGLYDSNDDAAVAKLTERVKTVAGKLKG